MLRLTARYADAWNTAWYGMPEDKLRRAFVDLDEALGVDDVVLGFETPDERSLDRLERVLPSR
jgi:hypothetical protein